MKVEEARFIVFFASVGEHPPAWYWRNDPGGEFEHSNRPLTSVGLTGPFETERECVEDAVATLNPQGDFKAGPDTSPRGRLH
jgi:hypothetical protein